MDALCHGPRLVGLVLLVTACAKAIYVYPFVFHLNQLGILPERWPWRVQQGVAFAFIAGEGTLGVALLRATATAWSWPLTLALLAFFSATTLWGMRSARTADCGCYGGLLTVPPRISLLLNVGYALLIGGAWAVCPRSAVLASEQLLLLGLTVVALVGLSIYSDRYAQQHRRPPLDISPLKPGRRWHAQWQERHADQPLPPDALVVLMNPHCNRCKSWLPTLRSVHAAPQGPAVVLLLTGTGADADAFRQAYDLPFAIYPIARATRQTLVYSTPTAVRVQRGEIVEKWLPEQGGDLKARFTTQSA